MAEFKLRGRQLLSLGVLAACISSVSAAPSTIDDENSAMTRVIVKEIGRSFTLPKELKLDPELRKAGMLMSAAHLARMGELMPSWLEEEKRVQSSGTEKANANEAFMAVMARMLNELALWQLEPGDANYEKATLEVLKSAPAVCETAGDSRFSDFANRMLRVQAMPAAQQQHALATERQLLERWGKPRPAPRPWPNPMPQDSAMASIAQIQAGGPRPPFALPPHLASTLLAERMGYKKLAWEAKCSLQQWWLRVSLAQGAAPATVLSDFRYGTLITATERLGSNFDSDEDETKTEAPAKPAFPKLALRFDVTGVTTLTRHFDAAGKAAQVSVTGRKITVPGIRGIRPVAFEDTFDETALQYALKTSSDKLNTKETEFQMVWNLEPHEPAAAKGKTKSPGKAP